MNLPIILRVFKGEHVVEVKQFQLDQIVIGNQQEVNVPLVDSMVSPIHALIERRGDIYYLCDLGSTNGTFKGGGQVLDELLESGDEFHVGPFRIQFFIGAPKPKIGIPVPNEINIVQNKVSNPEPEVKSAPLQEAVQSKSNIPASPKIPPVLGDGNTYSHPNSGYINQTKVDEGKIITNRNYFTSTISIPEENEVIKSSKGSVLEVSVGWKERIIETYHFRGSKSIKVGTGDQTDIPLPTGIFAGQFIIADFQNGVASINLRNEMNCDLILDRYTHDFSYLKEKGRFSSNTRGNNVIRLEQGEAIRVSLVPGLINIYIRYVPSTKKPSLLPVVPFTTGELAGVLLSTALVGLLGLYNAVHAPIELEKEEIKPEIVSITKFVYPKIKPPPEPKVVTPPPPVEVPPPAKPEKVVTAPKVETPPKVVEPPKEKQKAVMGEKKQASSNSNSNANNNNQNVAKASTSGNGNAGSKAAEVAPNKNMSAKKTFTSIQQGGSVKLGAQAGANASQTQKPVDLSTVGLTSTFGGGGVRNKLAQAVQGAGGIIGDANQATGTSGFSKDRPGDDLGSAFKDTGAGGKGVASEGISGGITNGRGSGNSGYGGVGSGLGNKGGVSVDVGGYGASFAATIDKNGVLRVIRSKRSIIQRCYEKELRFKKGLSGRVVVAFEIDETGKVITASIKESSIGDTSVENCIRNELVTWQFPEAPPNSTADVVFPFNFQNKE